MNNQSINHACVNRQSSLSLSIHCVRACACARVCVCLQLPIAICSNVVK